ncbi:hypothetical protein N7520_011935 [Penicillium odoratum]|uniref:uncharacterized protein n=1 Tax=Penicillium odoratum TaxID=1167516 RepID=UPI002548A2D8|nr:uncharacterized protein N7520_011935 [Penicillium odoratum]KAJ5746753.1 hypothetical protein N7520_011935 [Penicillium odoratum]
MRNHNHRSVSQLIARGQRSGSIPETYLYEDTMGVLLPTPYYRAPPTDSKERLPMWLAMLASHCEKYDYEASLTDNVHAATRLSKGSLKNDRLRPSSFNRLLIPVRVSILQFIEESLDESAPGFALEWERFESLIRLPDALER